MNHCLENLVPHCKCLLETSWLCQYSILYIISTNTIILKMFIKHTYFILLNIFDINRYYLIILKAWSINRVHWVSLYLKCILKVKFIFYLNRLNILFSESKWILEILVHQSVITGKLLRIYFDIFLIITIH